MKYLMAALLLISGCSSFDAQHMTLEVTKAVVTVVPNAKFKSPNQRGSAFWFEVEIWVRTPPIKNILGQSEYA